jgi:hypothetical protein
LLQVKVPILVITTCEVVARQANAFYGQYACVEGEMLVELTKHVIYAKKLGIYKEVGLCPLKVPCVCSELLCPACSLNGPSMHVPCLLNEFALHVPCMFPACSLHVPCMFPACSLHVPCMAPAWPCMAPAWPLHGPCMFYDLSLNAP